MSPKTEGFAAAANNQGPFLPDTGPGECIIFYFRGAFLALSAWQKHDGVSFVFREGGDNNKKRPSENTPSLRLGEPRGVSALRSRNAILSFSPPSHRADQFPLLSLGASEHGPRIQLLHANRADCFVSSLRVAGAGARELVPLLVTAWGNAPVTLRRPFTRTFALPFCCLQMMMLWGMGSLYGFV